MEPVDNVLPLVDSDAEGDAGCGCGSCGCGAGRPEAEEVPVGTLRYWHEDPADHRP